MRIGIIAAALLAVLLALYFLLFSGDWTEETPAPAVTSESQQPSSAVEEAVDASVPTFDIVRVEKDGSAVVAGRSLPGAEITLRRDGEPIATVTADGNGEWVILLDEPLAPGNMELTLSARNPDGTEKQSTQRVAVSVAAPEQGETLIVLSEPGKASRILQGPGVASDTGNLILETVDYDEDGNVIFAGRADPGSTVRVYVGGKPVGDAVAGEDGRWELRPTETIEPGVYALRLDQLNAAGDVVARVELPFERGVPELVRQQIADGKIVIQPGNNLWTIAGKLYGSGFRYTVIYEANRDQIRDPDLIYPGQIFTTPGAQPAEVGLPSP